jgi:hypothetical protein
MVCTRVPPSDIAASQGCPKVVTLKMKRKMRREHHHQAFYVSH